MKNIILIISIIVAEILVAQTPTDLGTLSYNSTGGSSATDEPVNVFFKKGITYVFGNTNCTTISNDMIDPHGGTDVYVQKINEGGVIVQTKQLGGYFGEKLIKVIKDEIGFWLFVQSSSNISGNRSVANCYMFGPSGPTTSDIWMVRLDYNLNIIAQRACCIGPNTIPTGVAGSNYYPYKYKDIIKTTDGKFRILMDMQYRTVTPTSTMVPGYSINLIEIDSTGNFIRHFELASNITGSYINKEKLTGNKIVVISDSVCYILGSMTFRFTGTTSTSPCDVFAAVYRLNVNSSAVTGKVMSSDKSQSIAKTGIVKNGKLHIYVEDIPVTSSTYNYYTSNFSAVPSLHIRRTATAKAITNKKDVWCVVIDTTGLNLFTEYSIGTGTEDVEINTCSKVDNDIVLGCSTKGGIGISKTTPSNGGLDYWLVRFNNSNQVISDLSLGGSADETLVDMFINNGVFVYTGKSKSGISGNKSQASYDSGLNGDAWTLGFCYAPIINVTPSQDTVTAGNYVVFNNNTQYAYNYEWFFVDDASSGTTTSYETNPVHYYNNNSDSTLYLVIAYNLTCSTAKIEHNPVVVLGVYAGINELNTDIDFKVFPNPFTEELNFSENLIGLDYHIYNGVGEMVISGVVKRNLRFNELVNGYYTLEIIKENKKIEKKLLKF